MPVYTSIATALDRTKLASTVTYLTLLEVDVIDPNTLQFIETLRFVHNNEAFTFQGNVYEPLPVSFEVAKSRNEIPSLFLNIVDQQQVIQAYLQAYAGGVDWPVRVKAVSTANPDSVEWEETFTVQTARAKSDEYMVTFELGAENPLSQRFPARLQFPNQCFWRYKGAECKYVGPLQTCDFTLDGPNGCNAHNNSVNFGAFPGIRRNVGL